MTELGDVEQFSHESAHYIHPYPGTMTPRVARELLNRIRSSDGTRVLDPFAGAGGVLVEAAARGVSAEGWDSNPLACLISRVKLTPVRRSAVSRMIKDILEAVANRDDPAALPDVMNVDYWYLPHIRDGLASLSQALTMHAEGPTARLALASTLSHRH